MKNRAISAPCLAVAVACVFAFSNGRVNGQSVLLKPKLEPGQKHYIERLAKVVQGGGPSKMTIHSVYGVIEEVKSSSTKETQLVLTLDRCGFRSGAKEIGSFDTDLDDKGQSEGLGPILRAMVGSALTLKLDKDYTVLSCKGAKGMVKKVEKKIGLNPLWAGIFKKGVDNENYKANWGDSRFVLYPNKEVKVGDTWKKSYVKADRQIGKICYDYEMKLDRIEPRGDGALAVVTYTATMSMVEGGRPADAKLGFKSGQLEGTATFDSQRGLFTKIEQKGAQILLAEIKGKMRDYPVSVEEKITLIPLKGREKQKEARRQGMAETEKTDKPSKDK